MLWSMNWPHSHTIWETPRSEKMFWCTSLKIRLLMNRLLGPVTGLLLPSA
jgi:hypothetical protein